VLSMRCAKYLIEASPADRDNIIRFLELLIRNLKRVVEQAGQ
jgi:hypothetical protein